jgi:hypothetical protein
MALTQRGEAAAKAGECRRCGAFCDKLVDPWGCIQLRCAYLYTYVDELSGRRFIGCMNKVFKGEVDLDAVEAGRGALGGLKMTGDPLPQCQFTVERAYEGDGPAYDCVNPRFFDCVDEVRVFDLRNALI